MFWIVVLLIFLVIIILSFIWRSKRIIRNYYIENSPNNNWSGEVQSIISNSGWNKKYNLIRTYDKSRADIILNITPRHEMIKTHPPEIVNGEPIYFSYTLYTSHPKIIHIDEDNWKFGVRRSGLSLEKYREYVINHEIGHALGYDHVLCRDKKCSVMYQSTRGCPNECGYSVELKDLEGPKIPV
jgi:predicted Zn-dependent protease